MKGLISIIEEQASRAGIRLQLDPTFHPDFELYDGVMVKLVCQGLDAPVAIASGGRYDALVQRFSPDGAAASGVGFSFAVEAVRQLLEQADQLPPRQDGQLVLVAFSQPNQLHPALNLLEQWQALLLLDPRGRRHGYTSARSGRNRNTFFHVFLRYVSALHR